MVTSNFQKLFPISLQYQILLEYLYFSHSTSIHLGQEDPLEEGMATHSSILARRIPWTEEPSRLQSIGLQSWT